MREYTSSWAIVSCVFRYSSLCISLLCVILYPEWRAMGLSAECIAQSEQRHLTLALGELPGMDCFGVNFHNCFKNVKLRCRILEYSFAQGLFFLCLYFWVNWKTPRYIISHRTLSHFTINEGEKGNGLFFF